MQLFPILFLINSLGSLVHSPLSLSTYTLQVPPVNYPDTNMLHGHQPVCVFYKMKCSASVKTDIRCPGATSQSVMRKCDSRKNHIKLSHYVKIQT
ncbi:hypothetical protein CHARACLAT_006747 [Characodon lateralis]|uniref:Secreted protein n=1 Tax=Characodon lateralis TaxID=208331 RepID=A0ABU7D714_9TELE|nr:hypothetical protein [Characodon lateralis]